MSPAVRSQGHALFPDPAQGLPRKERKLGDMRVALSAPGVRHPHSPGDHEDRRRQAVLPERTQRAAGKILESIIKRDGHCIVSITDMYQVLERYDSDPPRREPLHVAGKLLLGNRDGGSARIDRVVRQDCLHQLAKRQSRSLLGDHVADDGLQRMLEAVAGQPFQLPDIGDAPLQVFKAFRIGLAVGNVHDGR